MKDLLGVVSAINGMVTIGGGFWWVIGGFPPEYYSPPTFIPIAVVWFAWVWVIDWAWDKVNRR